MIYKIVINILTIYLVQIRHLYETPFVRLEKNKATHSVLNTLRRTAVENIVYCIHKLQYALW